MVVSPINRNIEKKPTFLNMERLKRGTKRLNMIIDLAYNLAFPTGIYVSK